MFRKRLKQSNIALHVLQTWKEILEKYQTDFERVIPAITQIQKLIKTEQASSLSTETFKKLRRFIVKFLSQFIKPISHFPLHEVFCYNLKRPLQDV